MFLYRGPSVQTGVSFWPIAVTLLFGTANNSFSADVPKNSEKKIFYIPKELNYTPLWGSDNRYFYYRL
jgi:hypothetical protein